MPTITELEEMSSHELRSYLHGLGVVEYVRGEGGGHMVEAAKRLMEEHHEMVEALGDKPVRLIRSIVYEGTISEILVQLGRSQRVGHIQHTSSPKISIYQGPFEILGGK